MHRVRARRAPPISAPPLNDNPGVCAAFATDAAHVPGGHANAVAVPRDVAELAAVVKNADRVLPVGAQSSLTGGATPRGGVVLSTRALTTIGDPVDGLITVGAGVPLAALQQSLAARGLFYPPMPTFDGAFVGGVISTNAAGAATFKYGATRAWVAAVTVVLANGDILSIARGDVTASPEGTVDIETAEDGVIGLRIPSYTMPVVAKLSAGYFARPGMDLVDLFVGSEGTLGVIADATLRVIPRPRRYLALVRCSDDARAVAVTTALRAAAHEAWAGRGVLDVAAVEYMDARSLKAVPDDVFARAGMRRPDDASVLLLVQIETHRSDDRALDALAELLAATGVQDDPRIATPEDERGAQRLLALREAVPSSVNALVAAAQARVHPEIQKTAGDMVVPIERLGDSLAVYRRAFESRHLDYAVWGHVSDGNLHPNVIPQSLDDVERGREAILEIGRAIIAMGGAPLAEHGVGRSALKQQLLRELYGEAGIEQMRLVKRALDPDAKLAPGVLFPET